VLYGVMTSNAEKNQAKLKAQLDTWAAVPVSEGRFFAVTGMGNNILQVAAGLLALRKCSDDYGGLPCKEEELLETGGRVAARTIKWTSQRWSLTWLAAATRPSLLRWGSSAVARGARGARMVAAAERLLTAVASVVEEVTC